MSNNEYNLCGAVSWRLDRKDGTPMGRENDGNAFFTSLRLVLTFYVPYTGPCSSPNRGHRFSIRMYRVDVDEATKKWKWKGKSSIQSRHKGYYDSDHYYDMKATQALHGYKFPGGSEPVVLLDGHIDKSTCKPTLTINVLSPQNLKTESPGSTYL